MDLSNRNIGYGITGSFCTFAKTRKEIQRLTEMGAHVIPIFSYQTQNCDTRFGTAKEFMEECEPGVKNLTACCKAMLDAMLEGDGFIVEPKSRSKVAGALTVRYYVDNLHPGRRKYSEVNQ